MAMNTTPVLTDGERVSRGIGGDKKRLLIKTLVCVLLAVLAIVSAGVIAPMASSVETHGKAIAFLDERKDTVMALTASSATASAVISAIPDDTATPISEKLADISEYFLIVLCVLYTEKYLITVLGFVAFGVMIPAACVLFVLLILARKKYFRHLCFRLGLKLLVGALLFYLTIPGSIGISKMIYKTYDDSINATISSAEGLTDEAEEAKESGGGLWNAITGAVSGIKDKASKLLNSFVEVVAVMVVTSCVIPILVVLFFGWLIKVITGVDIPMWEIGHRLPRHGHGSSVAAIAGTEE